MQTTLYWLAFLASAPIGLMPASLALFTKSHRVVPICCLNMLVWGGIYLHLKSAASMNSMPSPELLILLLIGWLVLLRFAILPKKATGESETRDQQ